MRRILLTMAVALFSVTAPVAPANATTQHHSAHRAPVRNAHALAITHLRDHRHRLEFEATSALSGVATRMHLTLQQLMTKWQRVAICEVNGRWNMVGPNYSGIGFLNINWEHFGGTRFAPRAGDATPVQQVLVAMRITQTWIPDQYGCSPVGW